MRILRAFLPALFAVVVTMLVPAVAAAEVNVEIVNESGRSAEEVFVTVAGKGFEGSEDVAGEQPRRLSELPGQAITIQKLISGRLYISYKEPVKEGVTFASPTRFDWAELTVTPASTDVANLTAVDQFAIGMRLDTFGPGGGPLQTVADANSDTIFDALQQIPGGPQATIRDPQGEILRVLSPNHSAAYPLLTEYVQSMAGQTITLHTAFFGTPFTTSEYSGTFMPDGSIALHGTSNPPSSAPATIAFSGAELIGEIYGAANSPNDLEGAIRRDLFSGFSAGFWDGKYGNDALSFCSNPQTTAQGSWCPNGFNQPSFGDARAALSPFPTCEQYAAVINQYTDAYGNPYSDASKKVTVSLDPAEVTKLRLTILPDSGNSAPVSGGNSNCGAGPPAPPAPVAPSAASTKPPSKQPPAAPVALHLRELAKVRGGKVKVGTISCRGACGRVVAAAVEGKTALARGKAQLKKSSGPLTLKLTGPGKKQLVGNVRIKVLLTVTATSPAGVKSVTKGKLTLGAATSPHAHR